MLYEIVGVKSSVGAVLIRFLLRSFVQLILLLLFDFDSIQFSPIVQKELFVIRKQVHSRGSVLIRWDPTNKYLATVGINRRVNVYDRNGNQLDEFALTGKSNNAPMQVEWDKDGENLAVLCDGQLAKRNMQWKRAECAVIHN